MAQLDLLPGVVPLVVLALGLGTFGLRLSFILLYERMDEFPPRIERALAFVPAAVLAALVFPELVSLEGPVLDGMAAARLVAGGLAAVTAWRTGSMIATIGVGMGVLWGARLLVG